MCIHGAQIIVINGEGLTLPCADPECGKVKGRALCEYVHVSWCEGRKYILDRSWQDGWRWRVESVEYVDLQQQREESLQRTLKWLISN